MMTRRKSVCYKWTLVLIVFVVCPFVYSRPQETSQITSSSTNSVPKDIATENPIRYRFRLRNLDLPSTKNLVVGHVNSKYISENSNKLIVGSNHTKGFDLINKLEPSKKKLVNTTRISRLIKRFHSSNDVINKNRPNRKHDQIHDHETIFSNRKPTIRKVLTKWTDKTKYEDLSLSYETPVSTENDDSLAFTTSGSIEDETSTENIIEEESEIHGKRPVSHFPNKFFNKLDNNKYYGAPQNQENTQLVHSNKVHIIEYPFPSIRPAYIFTTPTPTPIITNIGNPKPWPQKLQTAHRRPTTQKPVRVTKPLSNQYNYHNSVHNNYPQSSFDNFEVTTFQPTYTERIVIRPEEYSAPSADCPTIYLTLNNSFQGQGKEACPDLNIAVNTNVVTKNVVVESEEEEDAESLFSGGLGLEEDESADDSANNSAENSADNSADDTAPLADYFDSDENQNQDDSASVEAQEFSNYNSNNAAIQAESGEPAGFGSNKPSSALSHKPGLPGLNNDDDTFSISSIISYFRPTLDAMQWLAAINPLSFGIVSFLLTPLALIVAGYSGVAALLAPLGINFGREAPKVVHVYRPHWEWDHYHKTWQLHSFPDNRRWRPRLPRNSIEIQGDDVTSGRPTLFYKIKQFLKGVTNNLKSLQNDRVYENKMKHRKKRVLWTGTIKISSPKIEDATKKKEEATSSAPATQNAPRNVKTKSPIIGDSIKMVANQLLDNPSNTTVETPVVIDTRIPPKLKNQISKHKIKTRNEDGEEPLENAHPGIAVPVTMEELEKENKVSESSTSNEGISTWILLSNPANKENVTSTEPTKAEEPPKKQKPSSPSKNKTKRPQNNKVGTGKRPIIGSTNKSDLVAGGSAINENVYNKIKDTVLSNVQKNKNTSTQKTTVTTTTTTTTTTVAPSTEALTTKKDSTTKPPSSVVQVKVTSKPTKKKNKNKNKSTTAAPVVADNESALLPMEPKEQEIELEISTPPTTTKKPKRTTTRKKNKTKKRKTSKPKPETPTAVSEVKTTNKTKSTKTKKPSVTSLTSPITSQIYNYLSREVMPTVGVGALGLATLVGIAGYFLYPFSTPVRRTFEVDKKDDIYRHNAEEYASEGNGQAEEEMLGTVLAGMPAHSKHKLNPYAGQTAHVNRYPVKKEQDIRYRHVATKYEPNYNVRFPQQKTGIAHGAVYAEPVNYNPHQYETRHVYTTESKYVYDKGPSSYTSAPVEPIYAAPQTGPSSVSAYGGESSNSFVYGVKPSPETDFKPVYPFESQFYSETTSSPMTYPPTSMYLGSNNDADDQKYAEEEKYSEETNSENDTVDNKFVVGNVPKELVDTATPAVVPEHGPRKLNRKRRFVSRRKRSISTSIEEILKSAKENNNIFIGNEIDSGFVPVRNLAALDENMGFKNDATAMPDMKDTFTVYGISSNNNDKTTQVPTTVKNEIIESVSTIPLENSRLTKTTTVSDISNELETTTKPFRVYEVFTSTDSSSPLINPKGETTTQFRNMNTETTTELKSETTSTLPPSLPPVNVPLSTIASISTPKPTNNPEVLTYPPLNQDGGFFTFLKRLIEFKYRLGLSILQTTSENLNRYLRSMENSVTKLGRASKT